MMETLKLVGICLRIGALVFGGGMVMIPLLEADVVDNHQWLSKQEFVDAVALGQLTPGPLLVTLTFVGWKVGAEGGWGWGLGAATLATIAIFLPSVVFTIVASKHVTRLQQNRWVAKFLWGVRAAVVGMIVGAAVSIAQSACGAADTVAFALGALIVLLFTKIDAGLVVIVCGLTALVMSLL